MDDTEAEALLEQLLTGPSQRQRREAFVALIASSAWRMVLAPHVITKLCPDANGRPSPDPLAFRQAASHIATDEEKIYRTLELLGGKCTDELVLALARHMGAEFVEHALVHLRTAEGDRIMQLENVLHEADPLWVRERGARRVIRVQLKTHDRERIQLMTWLADAGNLGDFLDEIREFPPNLLEEWSALGRCGVNETPFVNRALSQLGASPEPLAYLLRLDPVPPEVLPRIMAAAKPEWLLAGLEVAILEGLDNRLLLPLVELGARLGGRHLAAAVAWLNVARLGPTLLRALASQLHAAGGRRRLSGALWVQRRAPSASRALEQGRRDETPDTLDAAALVRQLQGARMLELVQEILEKPRPAMMETVLRPLCAVNPEAASEVVAMCRSVNPDLALRAREALAWPDVVWPEEQQVEPPASFTPLGKGI
jgi:hypothetical protein